MALSSKQHVSRTVQEGKSHSARAHNEDTGKLLLHVNYKGFAAN